MPEGAPAVGVGLIVGGLTAYGFLVISARVLGPERYASLSALWALVFVVGPGFFIPLEQEVDRALAARRARGVGGGHWCAVRPWQGECWPQPVAIGMAVGARPLLDLLFDGQILLLMGLILAVVVYAAEHLLRGTLAGNGRFRAYGLLFGGEGFLRLAGCAALALFGIGTAGPYGVVLGLAPFAAIMLATRGQDDLITAGPGAPWSGLSGALGYLGFPKRPDGRRERWRMKMCRVKTNREVSDG